MFYFQREYELEIDATNLLTNSLEHDNRDCIIQNTFSEDDGIQFRINVERVEDRKDGDGIRGRES